MKPGGGGHTMFLGIQITLHMYSMAAVLSKDVPDLEVKPKEMTTASVNGMSLWACFYPVS